MLISSIAAGSRYITRAFLLLGLLWSITAESLMADGLAPSQDEMLAILPGKTINGTTFVSSTRFDWNGEEGNWFYIVLSANVGRITQVYDEDITNSTGYREETTLTFTSQTSGTYLYREFSGGFIEAEDTGDFYFPWLSDIETTWYDSASNIQPEGWRYFSWFKGFKPEGPNWIYHGRHGWLYVIADNTSGMFLWDVALGRWMFTNATAYPWMYAYGAGGGWVFFFEGGSPGSRYFARGDNAQIVSEQELTALE